MGVTGDPSGGTVTAGSSINLYMNFANESSGVLVTPTAVQLDITAGSVAPLVPDAAGPFAWSGASSYVPGQVWQAATGQFAFAWPVPSGTPPGVYVATWTITYSGDEFLTWEAFIVLAPPGTAVPSGDIGFWTGSIDYVPSPANLAMLTPVSIPLGSVDDNGICWLINKLEGWDGPDVQGGGITPAAGDHGGFPSAQFYAPRNMTLTVTASAPTQALRDMARALLQQAIPVNDMAVLTYNEPVPKQVAMRRSGKLPETYPTLCDVQFTIGAVAPDPRKYSVQVNDPQVEASPPTATGFTVPFTLPLTISAATPGGAIACTNGGTFETRPVITITGPITSPALSNATTGQTVSWTGLVLASTDVLTVDFQACTGLLNGVYRPADLFSSWWVLPPGTSVVQLSGQADSGADMSVQWSDSWI